MPHRPDPPRATPPPPATPPPRDLDGPPPPRHARSDDTPGERVDAGRGRVFPCPRCGADLLFHIEDQVLHCPYCGYERDLTRDPDRAITERDLRDTLARLAEQRQAQLPSPALDENAHEVRCDSCGANVLFQGPLTSRTCPFCGSPIQRDHVHVARARLPVDAVLPFQVPREEAARRLRQWIASRWFAPNDFKRAAKIGSFQGVYIPYWTFDALTDNVYHGERGEHYWVTRGSGKNRRRVRKTRWYPASGRFRRFFDDVLVVAAHGVPWKFVAKLEPWPLERALPYTQEALAGFFAQTYEVELEPGFNEAQHRIREAVENEARHRIGGDVQRLHACSIDYGALTYKHLLLPLWILAYRYRDTSYRVVINAGTGEVQGERPWSWIKITLASLAAAAAAAGLLAAWLFTNSGPT